MQSARDDRGAHRKRRHRVSVMYVYPYIKLFSAHLHGLAAENRVLAAAPRSILRHRKANPAVALRPDIRVNSVIYAYYLLYSYQYKRCKFLVPYGSDVRNSSRVSAGAPCAVRMDFCSRINNLDFSTARAKK